MPKLNTSYARKNPNRLSSKLKLVIKYFYYNNNITRKSKVIIIVRLKEYLFKSHQYTYKL